MADVTYTDGLIRLGKPEYRKRPWHTINNTNFDTISRLGQDDETNGATLVAIPMDIQTLFGSCTNLKAALQYIYDNYMHATGGAFDEFDTRGIGLEGPLFRRYHCAADLAIGRCVYLTNLIVGPVSSALVNLSDDDNEDTLPSIGITMESKDLYEEIKVAVFGPLTNHSWNFLLPEEEHDSALKYIYVGPNGTLVQYKTGETPGYGLQIIGLVETRDTIFIKPDLIWGRME